MSTAALVLLTLSYHQKTRWTTVGPGMCAPSHRSLNYHPYTAEDEAVCGRMCLRRRACKYTVFDVQRGYCFLYNLCDIVPPESEVSLRLGRKVHTPIT